MTETPTPEPVDAIQALAAEMDKASAKLKPGSSKDFSDPTDPTAQAPQEAAKKPWKGKYPNPYIDGYLEKHPIALGINEFAESRGAPAEAAKLGEWWAATTDYYMATGVEINPVYGAVAASAICAAIALTSRTPQQRQDVTRASGGATAAPSYP